MWDEYGLSLDIPHDVLPPGHIADVKIHVSASGPYIYPDSIPWRPASAIYWISSTKNFIKPVQLGIWHSARGESLNSSHLRVVMADETQNLHYVFKYISNSYHINGSYVYMSINHFSFYGAVSTQDSFHGSLLYQKSPKGTFIWEYSFIMYRLLPNGIINRVGYINNL